MDITPEVGIGNLTRLSAALADLDARIRVAPAADLAADRPGQPAQPRLRAD